MRITSAASPGYATVEIANLARNLGNLHERKWRLTHPERRLTRSEWRLSRSERCLTRSEWRLSRVEWRLSRVEWRLTRPEWHVSRAETLLIPDEGRRSCGESHLIRDERRLTQTRMRFARAECLSHTWLQPGVRKPRISRNRLKRFP